MPSENSDLKHLTSLVRTFCEDREWDQFHSPKELAIGISTEAAELLDLFRFKSPEQMEAMFKDKKIRGKIEDEMADVLFMILRMAQMNNVDLAQAVIHKLQKNEQKYPIEKARGSNRKYNEE
ncbi:MAG: nucleotide pyrophosphohydrolase [Bdellovibrio sp.]